MGLRTTCCQWPWSWPAEAGLGGRRLRRGCRGPGWGWHGGGQWWGMLSWRPSYRHNRPISRPARVKNLSTGNPQFNGARAPRRNARCVAETVGSIAAALAGRAPRLRLARGIRIRKSSALKRTHTRPAGARKRVAAHLARQPILVDLSAVPARPRPSAADASLKLSRLRLGFFGRRRLLMILLVAVLRCVWAALRLALFLLADNPYFNISL